MKFCAGRVQSTDAIIDSTDQKGDICLHYAFSKDDANTLKYLLKQCNVL